MKKSIKTTYIFLLIGSIWACSLIMTSIWFVTLFNSIDEVDRTGGQGNIFEGVYFLVIAAILSALAIVLQLKKDESNISDTMQNPWLNLPAQKPYVLAEDKPSIDLHRYANTELRFDTLPEPFIGGLNTAEVIFLALNPGFRESDITVNMTHPQFSAENRQNQADPYNSIFYYFNGGFEEIGGYWWWKKKLGPLLRAGVTEQMLRDKIMLIEYLPYHSENAKKISSLSVPSQDFSFELVREAIRRKKTIIIMRSPKLWLSRVPELEGHYISLNSWLNVTISPKNMGQENFDNILKKLTQ